MRRVASTRDSPGRDETDRWGLAAFVTNSLFREHALDYLRAYRRYGYDGKTGQFWGSLNLDGTPVSGPRVVPETIRADDYYQVYEPRGHLDLWQPYVAGYEHPLATAQVYAYAAQLTGDAAMLDTARLFARLIEANLPPRACLTNSWYRGYAEQYAPWGTYAGNYGQTISFFIHMHRLTAEEHYLALARQTADAAIARLYHRGLLPGIAAFETLARALLQVRTPIGEAWILGRDEPLFRAAPGPTAAARLLPSGDTWFLLQGADRQLLVPDESRRRELWTSRVWPGALLIDGETAGTWRRAGHVLTVQPWRRLSRAQREAVETVAASLPLPGIDRPMEVRWGGR